MGVYALNKTQFETIKIGLIVALMTFSILVFLPASEASLSGIEITPDLTCSFTVDNVEIYANESATFTSTSYSDGGIITDYSWDFGDGTPVETSVNAVHTYNEPGIYTVTHSVIDDYGKMSIYQKEIVVGEPVSPQTVTNPDLESYTVQNTITLTPEDQGTVLDPSVGSYAQATS